MPKNNSKARKAERKERADDRDTSRKQYFAHVSTMSSGERLLEAIFGPHVLCPNCECWMLRSTDCMSPQCKQMRQDAAEAYMDFFLDDFEDLNTINYP